MSMGELSDNERTILNVLMAPGARAENSTWDAITDRSKLDGETVHRTLRALEEREPALVRSEVDTGLNERIWRSTYEAAEALEE